MTPADADFAVVKKFYQNLKDEPLEPSDPRYVAVYETEGMEDPVRRIAQSIALENDRTSARLLSGYRGSGKSTELRRLRKQLLNDGYKVILIDILDYLDPVTPVAITDFLLAFAGAIGDAMEDAAFLGTKIQVDGGYWEQLVEFLRSLKLDVEIGLPLSNGASLKAKLQRDPAFRRDLQRHMARHVSELYRKVALFVESCASRVLEQHEPRGIVVLVDSLEQIRGSSTEASEVMRSVSRLFADHAERLKFPNLHVVYLVPPYLKALHANIHALYSGAGLDIFPIFKVQTREGQRFQPGIDTLIQVVEKRGPWHHVFRSPDQLERLILASGGHFRDLLRLLREVLLRALDLPSLPVADTLVEEAIDRMRREQHPIANEDVVWLAKIARSKEAEIQDEDNQPRFAHFLDTNRVLCYSNGTEWYDVHPLIREYVLQRALALIDHSAPVAEDASPEVQP